MMLGGIVMIFYTILSTQLGEMEGLGVICTSLWDLPSKIDF